MPEAQAPRAEDILRERRALLRHALAHHPVCSTFREDVIVVRIGRARAPLCAGCVAFWPALLVGFPLVMWLAIRARAPWWALALAGVALASLQLASYAGWTRTRARKLVQKAALGAGAASLLAGLYVAPLPLWARGAAVVLLAITALAAQTRRLPKLLAACDACPWARAWDRCPGFPRLNAHAPGSTPSGWRGDEAELPQPWPWKARAPPSGAHK